MPDKIQEILKESYESGMKDGETNEKKSTAMKMLADGESNERISRYTGLSSEEINHLKNQKTFL